MQTDEPPIAATIPRLLTLDEAADALRICSRTLREHIRYGRLAYVSLGGGVTRQLRMIHPHDLMEFVERQRKTEQCPSTNPRDRKPTSTISSFEVVDLAEIQEQRRSERRKAANARNALRRKGPAAKPT